MNMIMFENIIKFANKFKLIINFDSAAIYDRSTNILNRKELDIYTIPTDYYGFSKYLIYNRSLQYNNIYNIRIFNIFHINEENNRFIKSCFNAKYNKSKINIFEDKYFDFFYEDDFINIIKYYIHNINTQLRLKKTINVCYNEKYKLSEIAKIIINNDEQIIIKNLVSNNNYTGDPELLLNYNINLNGLNKSLLDYENKYKNYLPLHTFITAES